MRRVALAILLILLVAVPLTACGGGQNNASSSTVPAATTTAAPSPPAAAAGSQIVISGMAYTVPPSVSPGEQLTVVNKDDAAHTVTADENNLFDIRISSGGGVMNFTAPATPGTYPFHCKYHGDMHGVLTVQ